MIELLGDLNQEVARSAACALGRMGRIEGRPVLLKLLRAQPSEEVIDAVSSLADEECIIQLGRIARTEPALADAALEALEGTDHPRADAIARAIRNLQIRLRQIGSSTSLPQELRSLEPKPTAMSAC
jgi:HEAT repeat protein